MQSAVSLITHRVRERVREEGVDLARDDGLAQQYVLDEVRRYSEQALGGATPLLADEAAATREAVAELVGFGPLQPFFDDETVEELWINAPDRVYIARNGVTERSALVLDTQLVRDLVERMLQTSGRRVDVSSPFVDASLPDGSRLHVVIPDVSRRHIAVNVRKFASRIRELDALVRLGSLDHRAATFLRRAVEVGCNILVSGATHTGKTTMLGALIAAVPADERIVTVEETFELDAPGRDAVQLQCRQPSLEGTGEITLRRLIKESLRMRPDRLIVGEVREAEALDLLLALNAGLPGMCSIHANSAVDALSKLSTLPLLAGRNIDAGFVLPTVAASIDLVVHLGLDRAGTRTLREIVAPTGRVVNGVIDTELLFVRQRGDLVPTGRLPLRTTKFDAAGVELDPLLAAP